MVRQKALYYAPGGQIVSPLTADFSGARPTLCIRLVWKNKSRATGAMQVSALPGEVSVSLALADRLLWRYQARKSLSRCSHHLMSERVGASRLKCRPVTLDGLYSGPPKCGSLCHRHRASFVTQLLGRQRQVPIRRRYKALDVRCGGNGCRLRQMEEASEAAAVGALAGQSSWQQQQQQQERSASFVRRGLMGPLMGVGEGRQSWRQVSVTVSPSPLALR